MKNDFKLIDLNLIYNNPNNISLENGFGGKNFRYKIYNIKAIDEMGNYHKLFIENFIVVLNKDGKNN